MTTLSPTISDTGISAPTYSEILASLKESVESIYGTDIVLDDDSPDGEILAIFALAIKNNNDAIIAAYNSFSPSTAQGTGLSSMVKINGISRLDSSNSQADVTIVGDAYKVITGGQIGDDQDLDTVWDLPDSVTIPAAGTITVTATCTTEGAVTAEAGTLTKILTPTRGWTSVTNESAATTGDDVESDATLRKRQSVSVSLPASTTDESITAAIANLDGVTRYKTYTNDTNTTDSDGLPAHSISCVVEGGTVSDIASTIKLYKSPGTATYGDTSYDVTNDYGITTTINFYQLTTVPIYVIVDITGLTGYVSTTAEYIQEAIAELLNTQGIGTDVYYGRLWAAANLTGTAAINGTGLTQDELDDYSDTFEVTAIYLGTSSDPTGTSNLDIAFNEASSGDTDNITVTASS